MGKKCVRSKSASKTTSSVSGYNSTDEQDTQVLNAQVNKIGHNKKATRQMDYADKKALASGGYSSDETSAEDSGHSSGVQALIL